MTAIQKPKRAFLAYCALADRLQKPKAGLMEALIPFFAPVCRDLAGKMFDASAFASEVESRYGLQIPRLAVLGLAEQLNREGLLKNVSSSGITPIYQYAAVEQASFEDVPGVTEDEIDRVLADFVAICRTDERLAGLSDDKLHENFLERLLHVDSMRILSRKDVAVGTKRNNTTITRKPTELDSTNHQALRLDFHVAQFLLDLKGGKPDLFNRVSDIAFANMAAEALACFRDPVGETSTLEGFSIYLDSPLLLDILGVNAEYKEYGSELLEMVHAANATALVFDDAVGEAEGVVAARLAAARSGKVSATARWAATAPHVLNALVGQIGAQAGAKNIGTKPDPTLDLIGRAPDTCGSIQSYMDGQMAAWQNDEARQHDQRSVWSMLRIRDSSTLRTKIREGRTVFIARNTALVRIANEAWRMWLRGRRHSRDSAERWAPVAMSDKQLAGFLWLQAGGAGNGLMSRSRLLAHCSSAIRPRPDVKARAYNLVLTLNGETEADTISALMEDKEGERALMRATRGDPEDVTPERLPFIIDQIKLAAGEYAATHARDEARAAAIAKQEEHDQEVARVRDAGQEKVVQVTNQADELAKQLAQETLQRVSAEGELKSLRDEQRRLQRQKKIDEACKFCAAFDAIRTRYRLARWVTWFAYAAVLIYALFFTQARTQAAIILVLTMVGFWFSLTLLEGSISFFSKKALRKRLAALGIEALLPKNEAPKFDDATWAQRWLVSMKHASTIESDESNSDAKDAASLDDADSSPSGSVEVAGEAIKQ